MHSPFFASWTASGWCLGCQHRNGQARALCEPGPDGLRQACERMRCGCVANASLCVVIERDRLLWIVFISESQRQTEWGTLLKIARDTVFEESWVVQFSPSHPPRQMLEQICVTQRQNPGECRRNWRANECRTQEMRCGSPQRRCKRDVVGKKARDGCGPSKRGTRVVLRIDDAKWRCEGTATPAVGSRRAGRRGKCKGTPANRTDARRGCSRRAGIRRSQRRERGEVDVGERVIRNESPGLVRPQLFSSSRV